MSDARSGASILIVDDDYEVREILAETLDLYGYSVTQADSAEVALDLISNEPELKMVITDVRMPGISGLELVARAQALRSDLKVILISGYFLPQNVKQRFLRKPFHMRDLAAAVAEELGGSPLPGHGTIV